MVWKVGALKEDMPAHLPANHISTVALRGGSPAGRPGLLGLTHSVGSTGGAAVQIDIFPGAFDDERNTDSEVDVETQNLVARLSQQTFTDPDFKRFAIQVYGRLIGETLAQ